MKEVNQNLTPLEWEIMDIIWELKKSLSVREVLETAYPDGNKAYTTVQTVMNNLEAKGFLKKEKIGLVNFYKPLIFHKDMLRKETSQFVKRVFGGSFPGLVNYLIDSKALTEEEINDLKKLIAEKGEGES
ncbi:MAG: BlaI/MecI/CopY family transcriptional regulator [Calditrichaceae bacterium]